MKPRVRCSQVSLNLLVSQPRMKSLGSDARAKLFATLSVEDCVSCSCVCTEWRNGLLNDTRLWTMLLAKAGLSGVSRSDAAFHLRGIIQLNKNRTVLLHRATAKAVLQIPQCRCNVLIVGEIGCGKRTLRRRLAMHDYYPDSSEWSYHESSTHPDTYRFLHECCIDSMSEKHTDLFELFLWHSDGGHAFSNIRGHLRECNFLWIVWSPILDLDAIAAELCAAHDITIYDAWQWIRDHAILVRLRVDFAVPQHVLNAFRLFAYHAKVGFIDVSSKSGLGVSQLMCSTLHMLKNIQVADYLANSKARKCCLQ